MLLGVLAQVVLKLSHESEFEIKPFQEYQLVTEPVEGQETKISTKDLDRLVELYQFSTTGTKIQLPEGFKQKRQVLKCPQTVDECQRRYNNCSLHGQCQASAQNGQVCYQCSCTLKKWTNDKGQRVKNYDGPVTWTGDQCQYQDVSVSWNILFFSTVGFIVALVYIVAHMYSLGPLESQQSAGGQRLKVE
ncbi:hypothetical protein EDD86DRAFT_215204 [Gorgonomyces haynaldii]|nr:hypothetical protein EDD86DRAFT_215204 [Gorgonomyces haynaldii]